MRIRYLTYLFFLFSVLLWCGLFLLAPYLASEGAGASKVLYYLFSDVCHQRPDRSFYLFGEKLAVCARCTGIYAGMLFGALAYPFVWGLGSVKTPSKYLLVFSLVPLGLDGVTQLAGLRESTNFLRVVSGFLFGVVLPYYLIPVLGQLTDYIFIRRR